MTDLHFLLPASLSWITHKNPRSRCGSPRHVVGHVAIVDPQATQASFATKNNRDIGFTGRLAILAVLALSNRLQRLPAPSLAWFRKSSLKCSG